MLAVTAKDSVIRPVIEWIRTVTLNTQISAPGIGCRKAESMRRPQCGLGLHRMVIGMVSVCNPIRRRKLRIGTNEISAKAAILDKRALYAGWNWIAPLEVARTLATAL